MNPTPTSTYDAFNAVKEFHLRNGQQVCDQPTELNEAVAMLRWRLICEEVGELAVAVHENAQKENRVKIADAIADLYYVTVGTAVSSGLRVEDQFSEEEENFDLSDLLCELAEDLSGLFLSSDFLRHVVMAWLRSLLMDLNSLATYYHIPLRECFLEVHRSNMSKNLSGNAASGEKYDPLVDPKGPGYTPPDRESILAERNSTAE
jgi:predicted HAD superfamily Cof-like phosphohydrolase